MAMNFYKHRVATAALCASLAVSAAVVGKTKDATQVVGDYQVEVKIIHRGVVIAEPSLVMDANKQAEITIDSPTREVGEVKLQLHIKTAGT